MFPEKSLSVTGKTESPLTGITDFNFERLGEAGSDKRMRWKLAF